MKGKKRSKPPTGGKWQRLIGRERVGLLKRALGDGIPSPYLSTLKWWLLSAANWWLLFLLYLLCGQLLELLTLAIDHRQLSLSPPFKGGFPPWDLCEVFASLPGRFLRFIGVSLLIKGAATLIQGLGGPEKGRSGEWLSWLTLLSPLFNGGVEEALSNTASSSGLEGGQHPSSLGGEDGGGGVPPLPPVEEGEGEGFGCSRSLQPPLPPSTSLPSEVGGEVSPEEGDEGDSAAPATLQEGGEGSSPPPQPEERGGEGETLADPQPLAGGAAPREGVREGAQGGAGGPPHYQGGGADPRPGGGLGGGAAPREGVREGAQGRGGGPPHDQGGGAEVRRWGRAGEPVWSTRDQGGGWRWVVRRRGARYMFEGGGRRGRGRVIPPVHEREFDPISGREIFLPSHEQDIALARELEAAAFCRHASAEDIRSLGAEDSSLEIQRWWGALKREDSYLEQEAILESRCAPPPGQQAAWDLQRLIRQENREKIKAMYERLVEEHWRIFNAPPSPRPPSPPPSPPPPGVEREV